MSQTFSSWQDVPKIILDQINILLHNDHSIHSNNGNDNVHKPKEFSVFKNRNFLTIAQKNRLFDLSVDYGINLKSLLESLQFETECVKVENKIYYIPTRIYGDWPHCNMFGMMDETGRIHT